MIFLMATTTTAQTSGAYYAFLVSDGLGQGIVIFLMFASVITWALMINKWISLSKAKKLSENFNVSFSKNKHSITALGAKALNDPSPVASIYLSGIEKLQEFYSQNHEKDAIDSDEEQVQTISLNTARIHANAVTNNNRVTEEQIIAIEAIMESEVSNEITSLESGVSFLATIVSVCPFIGLFGTVWGVMLAFVGMAQAGSADIGAMAPGIASALLTTVVGLIVAIPSVVGYNMITSSIRRVTVSMDNFNEAFIAKIKLEQASRGK